MITESIKITQKGQVTIPKEIRNKLQATSVYFEVINDDIVIRPVKDAAGSLCEFAKNAKTGMSIQEMKNMAWEEAVNEKTDKNPS